MNRNMPLILAVAGGALVWFLWRQRQANAAITSAPAPRLTTAGTWEYPRGSAIGPTDVTYRDPSGAVVFRPDYEGPVDFT